MGRVKIGVIGAGWWAAENIIPTLKGRADVELVAACTLGRAELQRLQRHFQIPFVTEAYCELLDQQLDGVVVSSPHSLHYEHAKAALRRGLHVLCEKPMVLRAAEAHDLAADVAAKQVAFVIPYGWNYTDLAVKAKEILDRGEIGDIEHVQCHMASAHRDLFNGKPTWWAENAFVKPLASTWSDPAAGGGFLHGQLSHALALMFYLTALEPAEVFAMLNTFDSGADRSTCIACRFANGATGSFGGTATMPPRSTYQVDLRIFGSDGMLLLDIERPRLVLRRNDGRSGDIPVALGPGEYSCVEPITTWLDLLQEKAVPNRSSVLVGMRVVEVLDAAFRSGERRAPVGVSHEVRTE
jgi:predicted dehydrogenase